MLYFKDDKQVTVYFSNGDIAVWKVDNAQYTKIIEMCQRNEWIQIETLHNQAKIIMTANDISVNESGHVVVNNIELKPDEENHLLNMIQLLKEKGCIESELDKVRPFLRNMLENPYIDATHELYLYCKNMDFEITEDGCFLAYKNVREDLSSIHDGGKTKHIIGQYTEVENFDTDRNKTCSTGLHFAAKGYLNSYVGSTTIVVKVNPKDVVAIPTDYNHMKGRCKRYMTVGILSQNGDLETTNLKAATGQNVVKTKAKVETDRKTAKKKAKNRIEETADNMKIYKNDVAKVAEVMNLSEETVKRNMRKYRERRQFFNEN
ncbi:MAG: hypothetical protein FWC41_09945 [Firmicutes bacterium]|nr:hypothetical protein [Bacillota bacterium]